jgi:hypothetical protein
MIADIHEALHYIHEALHFISANDRGMWVRMGQ